MPLTFHKKSYSKEIYNNSFRTILIVGDMTYCSWLQSCNEEFFRLHFAEIYEIRDTLLNLTGKPLLQFFIDFIRTLLSHRICSIIVRMQNVCNLIGQNSVHISDIFNLQISMKCIARIEVVKK